jgi:hypothetical protein
VDPGAQAVSSLSAYSRMTWLNDGSWKCVAVRLVDVAEADAAGLRADELHIGELVGRNQDSPALFQLECEDRACVAAFQCCGQIALDFLGWRVRLHDQLARDGLDSDPDFHGSPRLGDSGQTTRDRRLRVGGQLTSGGRSVVAAGPAADAAPRKPGHHLLGGLSRDVTVAAEPVSRAHLRHAYHRHAQQVRLVVGNPGILPDYLADQIRAFLLYAVEPCPDGGLVAEIGFEYQAICFIVPANELEICAKSGAHSVLVL